MIDDLYKNAAERYRQISFSRHRGCLGILLPLERRMLSDLERKDLDGLRKKLWDAVPAEYRERMNLSNPTTPGFIGVLCENPLRDASNTLYENILILHTEIFSTLLDDEVRRYHAQQNFR